MTTKDSKSDQPGYRGALPTRDDRLARPWVLIVFLIFIAVIVLSFLEVPSRFVPEPTPLPIPSIPAPSATAEPTESPSAEPSGSGSSEASGSASPSETPEP